jgi:hypothetical protein
MFVNVLADMLPTHVLAHVHMAHAHARRANAGTANEVDEDADDMLSFNGTWWTKKYPSDMPPGGRVLAFV